MKQKKLLDVQVTGGPGETWQGLLAALHLQHMDTATSQKLTVQVFLAILEFIGTNEKI